jgi:hypothetical protein
VSGVARDLTGTWSGIFNYPRSLPPGQFTAELRDHGGQLAGETTELGQTRRDQGSTLHALIEGRRTGGSVDFVKRYDAERRANTPVYYTGSISADGDEITGTWDIPGHWNGTFIMIRQARNAAMEERRVAETVR